MSDWFRQIGFVSILFFLFEQSVESCMLEVKDMLSCRLRAYRSKIHLCLICLLIWRQNEAWLIVNVGYIGRQGTDWIGEGIFLA